MAEVVQALGIGGQSLAERELGWNRRTIRKGMRELTSGQAIEDGYRVVTVRSPGMVQMRVTLFGKPKRL